MVNQTDRSESGTQKRSSKPTRSNADNENVSAPAISRASQDIPRQSVAIAYQDLVAFPKDEIKFKTGSSYKGNWNTLGMSGDGKFKIFHGVDYDGYLDDGMFHGQGIMWYPNNSRVEGVWNRGFNEELKYYYNDGLVFEEKDWTYCVYPDRRFKNEYLKSGIRPTGRTMLSDRIPPRPIPPGCYDTGDGFYNPATKCVTHPYTNEILRIPTRSDEKWIMENCRKSAGLPLFKFEDSGTLSAQTSTLEIDQAEDFEDHHAFLSSDEEEPVKEEKGVGRFEIVKKMVQNRAYRSKYILLDKQRNRGCKKHRMYLPTLKAKTKLNIFPGLRVTPPFKCIHEQKSIVTNKLLLLLKLLRTCENAGGVSHVHPQRLKHFRKEFLSLLREEEATMVPSEVESDLDVARALSHQLDSFILDSQASLRERGIVFGYNVADSRLSALKESQHRALRAKELAVLADMWPPPVEEKEAVDNVQVRAQKERKHDDETKCDVCLYLKELDAKKLLYRRAMLKILKGREETDSEIFEMTQTIVKNFIDYLMEYINEAILKIQRDIINELLKRAEKICKKRQEEKVEELKKQFKTVVDEIVDEAVSNTLQPIKEVIDNVIKTAISRIVIETKGRESKVEIDIKKSDAKVESMQNIMNDVVNDLKSNLPDLMKTEMVKGLEKEQTIQNDTDIGTKTEFKNLEPELSAPSEKDDTIPSTTEVTVDIFTSADKYRERFEEKKHFDDTENMETKQPNLRDDKEEKEFVEEPDIKPEIVLKEGATDALYVDLEVTEEKELIRSSSSIPSNEPLDQPKPLHFSDFEVGEEDEG